MLSPQVVAHVLLCLQAKQIADMRILLKDSAEREQELIQEREELQKKVSSYHAAVSDFII